MANQYDDFDDDDFEATNEEGPANLRKALKRAEKERKELEKQLNEIRSAQREQSVKSVLESKGVNAKIAKFIPSDVATSDQVEAWLAEYADVFGTVQKPEPQEEEVDPRALEMARLNGALSGAQQAPAKIEDQLKKLQAIQSKAELDELTGNAPSRFQR